MHLIKFSIDSNRVERKSLLHRIITVTFTYTLSISDYNHRGEHRNIFDKSMKFNLKRCCIIFSVRYYFHLFFEF